MPKNEVTEVKEPTAVTAAPAQDSLKVEIAQEDMMIPFLRVVQSLSEEVTPGKDKYNPDVRPGDIYDGVTRTIFKNAKVIVCGMRKYFSEWTPDVRGKLVGKHLPTSDVVRNAKKVEVKTDKGFTFTNLKTGENNLLETYGIVLLVKNEDGTALPGVLTLSKTSFSTGRQLSTLIAIHQEKGVPVFTLSTTSTSNSKGSWFKPAFGFDSYETDPMMLDWAKGLHGMTDSILFRNTKEDSDASPVDDNVIEDGLL